LFVLLLHLLHLSPGFLLFLSLIHSADIGLLFIVGFASSMIFGTLVGSASDKYGRKKLCLVFGLLYSMSCLTKHIKQFEVLMVGRLLGGISTSILFSSFESWMVAEHHAAQYPEEWLGVTFSLCTTGNGIVAIGSGVVAGVVRESWGPVAPFDVSLVFLLIGSVVVALTWRENTGDASIDMQATLGNAVTKMKQGQKKRKASFSVELERIHRMRFCFPSGTNDCFPSSSYGALTQIPRSSTSV
jgi:MFS family permease